jgi:hypothetical protein
VPEVSAIVAGNYIAWANSSTAKLTSCADIVRSGHRPSVFEHSALLLFRTGRASRVDPIVALRENA